MTEHVPIDDYTLDPENKDDVEKLASSRDTSGSPSPCPSEHDGETDDRTVVSFDEFDKTNPVSFRHTTHN